MGPFINDVTHLGERGDLAKGDITVLHKPILKSMTRGREGSINLKNG